MVNQLIGSKVITQIAIIVKDIETTSQAYADFFGVAKPEANWTDTIDVAQTTYRGEPSQARARLAFFDMGSVQLELIEPDEHPSTWREFLDEHGEGVHHIAFEVNGMKETLQTLDSNGFKLIQKGEYTGGRYAYVDTEDQLKVLLELLENDA
ncbi:VOC family protein [Gracilibacillus alcaliphilus]|uniref:VOC family protein n=1 Tax=Gracilibacillus alcaliphilus TaxID=1401441 RepID=UPI00195A9985|nr:VOC family protein [Gracilibacillus alcaliphilus]MBM7679683.1 methylmalonyl-CoA epimerase [Gracilibacillus alcaliphilus]